MPVRTSVNVDADADISKWSWENYSKLFRLKNSGTEIESEHYS